MSDLTHIPTPPIASAQAPHIIETPVPNVGIPHMGTSRSDVPKPTPAPTAEPAGVSQQAIDAAILQVQQTGNTDGIAPQVLIAACQQIEAQAAQQGIDLNQPQPPGQPAVSNYVEAAVMDKKGTFDNFARQRESMQAAVGDQRQAAQKPYQDALHKAYGGGGGEAPDDTAAMKALATELSTLDANTIALINAMGVLSNTPEVLKSLVWLEIIRIVHKMIAAQTKQQVEACLKETNAA